MPQPVIPLPRYTWGDVETVFDDLALTRAQKDAVEYLLDETRRHSRNLSPLDLLREIICIAFVLGPDSDRPPHAPRLRRS
ncbi:hypothetical protein [Brevundimonas diminuta]|uniref:hypothetical protein n=1 Tax=Brevundimonas diminuta TaxID=293 RepID=UPI0006277FFD|nr:hypothetical protein [Brevundimonas diminuta]